MKRFSKISIDDIKTIQVDSGVLLKEFDVENPVFLPENVICATSGGINPVCAPEYYDFGEDVDNAKSAKETKRIRGWDATISFTTLTTSLAAIKLALGAADISGKVLSLRQRLQYAKDFKDIWWAGKRADDKLIAIRLIRSLSDSGFSLQTNKRGKGQIGITLKGHSSFAEKDKIPMEVYIFAESDIPIVPDEPDTPTTAMYLYGTPSKVKYNGVELPDIESVWDKATLPYAYVIEQGSDLGVLLSPVPIVITSVGYIGVDSAGTLYSYIATDGTWEYGAEMPMSPETSTVIPASVIKWTSNDILNADGSVYLATSEPVHSGNIGLRSGDSVTYYDGAVLPKPLLDVSEFPYRYIAYQSIWGEMVLAYMAFQTPAVAYHAIQDGVSGTYVSVPVKAGTIQVWQRCLLSDDNKWESASKIETGSLDETKNKGIVVYTPIVWANVDINIGSSIYQHASDDPIPVSGLVDTINGIPIYEVKT